MCAGSAWFTSMSKWFISAFGTARTAVDETRHELLAGWFGKNFEPHPTRQQAPGHEPHAPGERDIHGNAIERGIDR